MDSSDILKRLQAKETILTSCDKMIQNVKTRSKTPKMPTGLGSIDEIVRGLHQGELTVIAARPSQGKTTMACQIGWTLAWKHNVLVAVFSLEMGRLSLLERIFCFDQKVNGSLLRAGRAEEVSPEKWENFKGKIMNTRFTIFDDVGYSAKQVEDVFNYFNMEKARKEADSVCLIFDHAQMCSQEGFRGKYEAISDFVRNLKVTAVKYDASVIVTSQLNRQGIGATGNEYLKGSGDLEESADVIWLCRYPIRISPDNWSTHEKKHFNDNPDDTHYYTVQIDKNRNGECGFVELFYEPSSFFFRDRREEE